MQANLINNLENFIENLNTKQKIIANRAKINKNFRFFESNINESPEIFFEDLSTKEIFNFVSYVKTNCGCD